MKNETAKITVTPYKAGTVNHATINETPKITDAVHLACTLDTINNTDRQIMNYTSAAKIPGYVHN